MRDQPGENADEIRDMVRRGYARVASGGGLFANADGAAQNVGYSREELDAAPEGANLGVGCGNPLGLVRVAAGETVLDLGSGAGFDAFLAARSVGADGHVIGVDMTPEMIERARANAEKAGVGNVEYRLGTIEELPVEDTSVDIVISNCVINLSPEKPRVFREAWRVLRPGGRLAVSDVVLLGRLPDRLLRSTEAYVGCVAGALQRNDYLAAIEEAGFRQVTLAGQSSFEGILDLQSPEIRAALERDGLTEADARRLLQSVASIKVVALK